MCIRVKKITGLVRMTIPPTIPSSPTQYSEDKSYLHSEAFRSLQALGSCNFLKVTQSCPTLCDLMDYTVHGILQARILERVAVPLSRGSSQPRSNPGLLHCRPILYQLGHQGSLRVREALSSRPFLLWCILQHMNTLNSSPAASMRTANLSMLSGEWRIIKERE